MLRGPRGQTVHLLETAALFTPHMVDLHGCFTLGNKIQVLLSQVGPELPDFKLTKEKDERKGQKNFKIRHTSVLNTNSLCLHFWIEVENTVMFTVLFW